MSNEKHKNLENLDLHKPFPQGVILDRPTTPANEKCPFYYATDTNVLYYYNGTSWDAMTGVTPQPVTQSTYTPFAINSGNVDSFGNGDILEIDSETSGKLNFKVGGSYISLTATTASGSNFVLSSIASLAMVTFNDGVYNIFVNSSGTILALQNTITRGKVFPSAPANGDVHFDTSQELLTASKYNTSSSSWQVFLSVFIGQTTITSGVITAVKTTTYNYNGYHVNKKNDVVIVDKYSNGTEWYKVWSDGYIEQGGVGIITEGYGVITLLKPFTTENYNIIATQTFRSDIVPSFNYADIIAIDSMTTSSFRILGSTNADTPITGKAVWEAKGY